MMLIYDARKGQWKITTTSHTDKFKVTILIFSPPAFISSSGIGPNYCLNMAIIWA